MHSDTQHEISAQDHEFRSDFEAFKVTPEQFNHAAHVRLAYIYLVEGDIDSAVQKMRESLRAFLQHHGIPPGKFHETLTRAWVLAVRHFMTRSGNEYASASAADFIAQNPELLDSRIMLTHYSASVLFSADARASFVEPDLDPIPRPMEKNPARRE
jgi:hypothetical protein